ncbi:HET-domain-containing protein [Mytilinidion resinicola]|uniref:HET-domain-containing protein n=1 Tax=Mytilinidion resinicola TaxID=574789 RepID=A0A6A6Y977_9PEZI|nr:HET-domain-containing protein [Mytilinidion resinicola]KAF2805103.1 HET-domain-containing protein [Mytilinidion resinicola]
MRSSRRGQSLVGMTLDGDIQVHSLLSQSETGPTYIAQDLSASTFYELKVFSASWVPRSKTHLMWREHESLEADSRFIKAWRRDRKACTLLRLPKAPLVTEEGIFVLDAGKRIAVAAGSSVRKSNRSLGHASAPVPDFDDETAFPSLGDGTLRTKRAKDTRYIAPAPGNGRIPDATESLNKWLAASESIIQNNSNRQVHHDRNIREATVQPMAQAKEERDDRDQKKERKRKKRAKKKKGREEKGEKEKLEIETVKKTVEENGKMEKEIKKENIEQQHQREEIGQEERKKGEHITLRTTATKSTAESTANLISSKFDSIALLGAAESSPTKNLENIVVPPTNTTMWQRSLYTRLPYSWENATNSSGNGVFAHYGFVDRNQNFNGFLNRSWWSPIIPGKSSFETAHHNQKQKVIVDTTRLYSELPIYYPRGVQAASQETEIRLIELKPEFMGDSIFCNMYCTSLQKKPEFIALSYSWGDVDKTHTIHARGYEVPVTKNLHQALMQLRKPQESAVLWVDAICIDQANVQDRNYQVKQMPKIYSAAQEVVAWLGESRFLGDEAMRLITLAPEDLRKLKRSSVQTVLDDLFSRPYWSRVWVVQELASANRSRRACTLRCGEKSVTLNQFADFLRRILRQIKISELQTIMRPRSLLSLSTQDPSKTFLHNLWESSSLLATDARDRIYGIRGISPKFYRDNIEVDYTIDFETLCRKVMALMVKKERSLDVLCYFHRYTSEATSPSWLRDFSKRNPGIPPDMYSCDKGRKANAEIVNRILRTRGVRIGRVAEIRVFNKTTRKDPWAWMPKTDLKLKSELSAIQDLAFNALQKHHPYENRFLEMFAGGKQQATEQLGKEYHTRWRNIWDKRIAFEKGTVSSDEWERLDESFCSTFARLIGRCVFTTVEGNLGLGPRDMQKNDLVCIIFGCRLPIILRKDGRYYTLIGPAYVDGAMNGKFVQESEKGDRFWIR